MKLIIIWLAKLVAAIIMLQTLYYKFTAQPESIHIFTEVGKVMGAWMEPWGRILTGVAELIASILLFVPFMSRLGALMGVGLMIGAIYFHLTILGIEVQGDGGKLFYLAVATLIACLAILVMKLKR
jgi:uncharacterized membrane protein YphA (DoxX/SURF4 family)